MIRAAIDHLDERMFVALLQYTVMTGMQEKNVKAEKLKEDEMFIAERSRTLTLNRPQGSLVLYDLVGQIARGAKLTRRSAARIKCAKKLFNELSTADVVYHDVKTWQDLMNIMENL